MSRARREPTDEELALWRHVTRDVTPQFGARAVAAPRHPTETESAPRETPPPAPRPRAAAPTQSALTLGATDGLDRRSAQRFARGQMTIDTRLDLHGLTLRAAHDAVTSFLRRAASDGRRCVLIVTGKGGAEKPGRIRTEAMHWLAHPALRPLILAVREARPQHGGGGALYVLLKRQRSA